MRVLTLLLVLVAYISCIGQPMNDLPSTTCQNEAVTLQVKTVRANVDNLVQFNTRAYFFEGKPSVPGPTLVMKPGTVCQLRVENKLSETSEVASCSHEANGMHCADTTNVHVHGLHVHPVIDDMGIAITPGDVWEYNYTIPEDHMSGTHWYHSHYHGTTTLHTHGGLAGAIDMLPPDDVKMPKELTDLFKNSKLIMLLHMNFGDNVRNHDTWNMFDYVTVSNMYSPQTLDPAAEVGDLKNFYTANVQYQPYIEMEAGVVKLLRLIHATGSYQVELKTEPADACEMVVIARDGVFQYTPYIKVKSIFMPQGGRADVAFKCKAAYAGQDIKVGSILDSKFDLTVGQRVRYAQDHIFTIKLKEATSAATNFPTKQAPFPPYLQDMMNAPRLSLPQKKTVDIEFSLAVNHIPFPGHHGDNRWLDSLCLGKVYEFSMFPGATPFNHIPMDGKNGAVHPFHQHIIHFQVSDPGTDDSGEIMRKGEWRDVVPVPLPNGFSYRFKPVRWVGDYMFHCHLTWHEDFGMMIFYDIVDCDPASAPKSKIISGGHGDGDSSGH